MLVDELVSLLGRRPIASRTSTDLPSLPDLSSAADRVYGSSGQRLRRIERLVEAAVARAEPAWLRGTLRALWGLPPYRGFRSTTQREEVAASLWKDAYDVTKDGDWRPLKANSLRRDATRVRFAELIAGVIEQLVDEASGRADSPLDADVPGARYRPKLPATVTTLQRVWHWLDDEGRGYRTLYEQEYLATRPTSGLHRIIIDDAWEGYRRDVRAVVNCTVAEEESLVNNKRRVVLQEPALGAGEQQVVSWEILTEFDTGAPRPDGGELFDDMNNDDFVLRLVAYFGERQPRRAWQFAALPRILVPGDPETSQLLGLDPQSRLAWNFEPPTVARAAYGLAWLF